MILTGYNTRSIADQTGIIGFNFSINSPSVTTPISVGISGTNTLKFTLNNGKIYDNNNNFVESYSVNSNINISGQLGQSSYDYYIYGNLIGQQCSIASGIYNSIFFNNPSQNLIDFDAIISGAVPNYYISNSGVFTGNSVVGQILNNTTGTNFRIFDVAISNSGSPFYISSFSTGNINSNSPGNFIIDSSTGNAISTFLPLVFYTDFGPVNVGFSVSGNGIQSSLSYLTLAPPNPTGIQNNDTLNFISYFSRLPGACQINAYLSYVSGTTGNIYKQIPSGNPIASISFSGAVTGCGLFSGYTTGWVTGVDPKLNIPISGTGSAFYYNNFCATGQTILYYCQIGSGYVNTGDNTTTAATGFISGYLTGIVNTGSGYYQFNQLVSGAPNTGFTSSQGFYQATGNLIYGNPNNGDNITINGLNLTYVTSGDNPPFSFSSFAELSGIFSSGYYSNYGITITGLSPNVNIQVNNFYPGALGNGLALTSTGTGITFTNPATTGGTTFFISGVQSGLFQTLIDEEANTVQNLTGYLTGNLTGFLTVLDYVRSFTGLWDLTTGKIDYFASGYISGYNYINKMVIFPSPNNLSIGVNYSNGAPYTPSIDLTRLTITGNFNSGIQYLISGTF